MIVRLIEVVSFKVAMLIKRRSIVNLYSCLVCSLEFLLSTDELQSEVLCNFFAFYIASRYQAVTYWLLCIIYLYQSFLTNFRALYLTEFLTDFGQILDSKSYDQA